jgi:DNA-directed RNA polymerase subunit F
MPLQVSTRTRRSRTPAVLGSYAVIAACALTTGCSSCKAPADKTDNKGDEQAPAAATGLTPEEASQVLARVGERTITVGDFAATLAHMDQFDRMRFQAPERRKELLREMIDVVLLADEAREKGYDKDPEAEEEIRQILRDAVLEKAREGAPSPSEIPAEEVRAYYDAHRADFRDPERRRVSLIVLAGDAGSAAVLDAARKASATEWGELVRAKSVSPQAKANVPLDLAGDFGFVNPPDDRHPSSPSQVPDEVRAAVFEIEKEGDVLPRIVKAGSKSYVVRLTKKTPPHDRTLEEAERMIRVKLAQEKVRAKEEALLAELRKEFPVTVDEAALAQVKVDAPPVSSGGAPPPADARKVQ